MLLFQQVKWLVPELKPCSSFLFFLKETRRKIYVPCHSSHTKSRLKRMLFWPLEVSQLSEPWDQSCEVPLGSALHPAAPPATHIPWGESRAEPTHPGDTAAHLWDAVLMGHHADNVIQREQGVALDLRVNVLALCAHGQELHQMDVVHEGAVLVHPVPLRSHHLNQGLERGSVVVEHEDILSWVNQLWSVRERGLFISQACWDGRSVKKEIYSHREMFCQHLPSKSSCIYITELTHTSFIFITKQLKNSAAAFSFRCKNITAVLNTIRGRQSLHTSIHVSSKNVDFKPALVFPLIIGLWFFSL